MPDYLAHFDPPEHIAAIDLNGKEATVTIEKVVAEKIGQKKQKKPVLFFVGKKRGMVLNKTNCKVLAAMYGRDTEDWKGKAITIFPTMTEMAGESVPCLRIKPGIPGPKALAAPSTLSEEPADEAAAG